MRFFRCNCKNEAELRDVFRTCSALSCHGVWPVGQRWDAPLVSILFAALHDYRCASAAKQASSSERAIMDTEDRSAGQEPLFALPFSRIHPSINSGHIVRRHTSKGLRGAKSKNVATRFSCTETWAVRRLAQMFAKLAAQPAAQPAAQLGFGSRHDSGLWSLAWVFLVCWQTRQLCSNLCRKLSGDLCRTPSSDGRSAARLEAKDIVCDAACCGAGLHENSIKASVFSNFVVVVLN